MKWKKVNRRSLIIALVLLGIHNILLNGAAGQSAVAPGATGDRHTWTNGNKQGLGTSNTLTSKVCFTKGGETGLEQLTIRPKQTPSKDDADSPPDPADASFAGRLKNGASPVITGPWVTFVYRGGGSVVELVGEMTDWGKRGLKLKPVDGTEIKYLTMWFPEDARIEYKYIVDGGWHLDGLNTNKNENGLGGENSFFTMPGYRPTTLTRERAGVSRGRVERLDLRAAATGQRAVRVYLPPGYDGGKDSYPTIYFGDGAEYLERARAAMIADNLIAAGRMRPVIMVFVAPLDRTKEYWMNKDYVAFLTGELVPRVDSRYRTIRSADSRAIAGASLGGLISAYAAHLHPEIFGNVLGQSSAFMVNGAQIISDLAASELKTTRWYLEVGRYEGLIDSNRRMKQVLESKGYRVAYKELNAGHNWTHWADALADGLVYLFPGRAAGRR